MTGAMLHDLASVVHCLRFSTFELTELLRARGALPDDARELVDEVDGASERVTELFRSVRTFLDQSREGAVAKVRCSGSELLERALSLFCRSRELRSRVIVERSAHVTLECDPILLVQALVDLLRNAAESGPPGTRIEVGLSRDGGQALFTIADQGPTLPPEVVDRLFDPFFSTRPDGSGVSLAVAAAVLQRYGGSLTYRRRAESTVFEARIADAEARR